MIQADPNAQKDLSRLLEILNPATEADSIPNPQFIDAKFILNRMTEKLFFCNGLYYNTDLWFTSSSQAANRIKLATKKITYLAGFINAAQEIQILHEALQSLKTKVVKRAVRSEEERADDYVPPMPTTEAATKVNAILKTMTDELTLQYEEILYNGFVSDVEYRMDHPRVRGERYIPGIADFLLQSIGENFDSFTGNYRSLKSDWKAALRDKAKKDADFAQRLFLYKNVMKLATILEEKGNFVNYRINYGRVNGSGFMGEIVFYFADDSSFVVRNKVVGKYSVHGKGFLQFPTTFHAAVLPNGTMMSGQPSEEEMKEVFVKVAVV